MSYTILPASKRSCLTCLYIKTAIITKKTNSFMHTIGFDLSLCATGWLNARRGNRSVTITTLSSQHHRLTVLRIISGYIFFVGLKPPLLSQRSSIFVWRSLSPSWRNACKKHPIVSLREWSGFQLPIHYAVRGGHVLAVSKCLLQKLVFSEYCGRARRS